MGNNPSISANAQDISNNLSNFYNSIDRYPEEDTQPPNATEENKPDIQHEPDPTTSDQPQQHTTTYKVNNTQNTNHTSITTLKIATSNLRGINNDNKRSSWFAQWHVHNWDLVITSETNSRPHNEKH
jgi:hypothetical protein